MSSIGLQELQNYTHISKYARWLEDKQRRELWHETVDRYRQMMLERFPQLTSEIMWACDGIEKREVLPSMRAIQFGGQPAIRHNARIFNCASTYINRLRAFPEAMYLLLAGCLPPDTKILAEKGPVRIDQIVVGDKVWSFNKITGSQELNTVVATHNVKVSKEENIKIIGRFGNFTTSKKHPVLVLRDKVWAYLPAGNLKIGDFIKKAYFPESGIEFHHLAYFVGSFLGDGCSNITTAGSRRIRMCGDNKCVIDKFANVLTYLTGEATSVSLDTRPDYSVPVWKMEKQIGKDIPLISNWDELVGKYQTKKVFDIKVPTWIRHCYDKTVFMSFLAGLIDTDGYVSEQKIAISTSSEFMKNDLLELCPLYGIYPWFSVQEVDSYSSSGFKPTRPNYQIKFSVRDFKPYASFLAHEKKRRKIENAKFTSQSQHKTLVIPKDLIDDEAAYLSMDSNKTWHFRKNVEKYGSCRVAYYNNKNKSFDHLIQYDEIIDIEDNLSIDENFKDITVENNHSYFAGDGSYYCLHNCGTGFSVQSHHIELLPKFSKNRLAGVKLPKKEYWIPDTIEGWADSHAVLLTSFHEEPILGFEEYLDCDVDFRFDKIRPKNAPLSFGVGSAPGPKPLSLSLTRNHKLIQKAIAEGLQKLNSVYAFDCVMHEADAVKSGGVRRAATICLFDLFDELMLHAKTGNWLSDNPQRQRANISAVLIRGEVPYDKYHKMIRVSKEFGEPGSLWASHRDASFNPCLRGSTRISTDHGLIRIDELAAIEPQAIIATDSVVTGKSGEVTFRKASNVALTQKDAPIYRVTLNQGHFVEATVNHRFPTKDGVKRLDELKIGDTLYVQSGKGKFGTFGSFSEGLILGLIAGDGSVSSEDKDGNAYVGVWEDDFEGCEIILNILHSIYDDYEGRKIGSSSNFDWVEYEPAFSDKKRRIKGGRWLHEWIYKTTAENPLMLKQHVPECVWQGSQEMVAGYLQGLFFSDGSVSMSPRGGKADKQTKRSLNLRFHQSNKPYLEEIQILLQNFGITSTIFHRQEAGFRPLPDGKGGSKEYYCKDGYDLNIARPFLHNFDNFIGIYGRKVWLLHEKLNSRGWHSRKSRVYYGKIKSIEFVCNEDVYCLTEPVTNSLVANGVVTMNCAEIQLSPYMPCSPAQYEEYKKSGYSGPYQDGKVMGWGMCNLTSVNGRTVESIDDFHERCRKAAFLGVLQKTFTSFPYLGRVTEDIVSREALLGVSICGIRHHPCYLLDAESQRKGAAQVKFIDETYSKILGINPSPRSTTVKPDGNSGSLLGSFSGIGLGKFHRGFRIVRVGKHEVPYQFFKSVNPLACEEEFNSDGEHEVIRFCVEYEGQIEGDKTAVEVLDGVKSTQINWVEAGRVAERAIDPTACHNVSNTVTVKPDEWDDVTKFIYDNQDRFAGVSLLSSYGDRDFIQAPFTAVYTKEEIVAMYGGNDLVFTEADKLAKSCCTLFAHLWSGCDYVLGKWSPETKVSGCQKNWANKVHGLAENFFGGDTLKATYIIKDCYNWDLWQKLKESYKPVDYSKMVEKTNTVDLAGEQACVGGKCDI